MNKLKIKRNKFLKCIIPTASVIALTSVTFSCSSNNISFTEDAKNMLAKYQEMVAESINSEFYDDKTIEEILANEERPMKELEISGISTYYFTDLDYDNLEIRDDFWPAKDHVVRAREMAVSAYKTNRLDLMNLAGQLVSYWVLTDHRCSNWWWNEIGGNRDMTGAAIFCFDVMPEKAQKALLGRLERSSFYYRPETKTHTGANLVDFAEITLKSSLLRKNQKEFEAAVKRMEEEITDENTEGFQKDGEFFQHGQQVQTCSYYGLSAFRMGGFMNVVSASKLRKFNKKKLHIISRFILEGLAPATHRGYINYLTMSREYVRENHLSTRSNDFSGIKYFINDDMPDADKIKEYSDHLDNFESTFSGLKYYDLGRMIMLNTDGLYMSFKGTADYLTNTECNNNENQLGLNLSYGTNTCVMDRGNEYYDINPVWDYAYLPGTTSYQLGNIENIGKTDPETNYDKYLSESDKMIVKIKSPEEKYYKDGMYDKHLPAATEKNGFYYGGGYDKEKGVAYLMQRSCHHEENNFTVTCIATKDGMVLLGADLGYTGSVTEDGTLFQKDSRRLHTTIEQTYTKLSQTYLSDDRKELTVENALYRTLDNHNISFTDRSNLVGHWKRNHTEVTADRQVVTPNIFIAYIDHALEREHAKYAYSIQHKNHKDEKFELVHNFDGNKVQEVKLPDGTVAIAAYENVKDYQPSKGDKIDLVKGDFKLI